MKTIDDKKLLQLGKNGDWFNVDKMIRQHLTTTNYNVPVHSERFNHHENINQCAYDNELNNAMGLGIDSALNTQGDKYDYLEFKIDEANRFVK